MSKINFKVQRTTSMQDIKRRLNFLVKSKVLIGVQGVSGNELHKKTKIIDGKEVLVPSEKTNVDIAVYNEFGTETESGAERIPERSFVRASVIENRDKYNNFNRVAYNQILKGRIFDINEHLELLGTKARDDMKLYARDLREPPNAQSTIDAKGSDNPLVNTSQMINSITYVVEHDT